MHNSHFVNTFWKGVWSGQLPTQKFKNLFFLTRDLDLRKPKPLCRFCLRKIAVVAQKHDFTAHPRKLADGIREGKAVKKSMGALPKAQLLAFMEQ